MTKFRVFDRFKESEGREVLDFIIDCALKLQEYNSDLKDLHLEEDYYKHF